MSRPNQKGKEANETLVHYQRLRPLPLDGGTSGNLSPLLHSPTGGTACSPLPALRSPPSGLPYLPAHPGPGPAAPKLPKSPPPLLLWLRRRACPAPYDAPQPVLAAAGTGCTLPSAVLGGSIATLRKSPTTKRASASVFSASASLPTMLGGRAVVVVVVVSSFLSRPSSVTAAAGTKEAAAAAEPPTSTLSSLTSSSSSTGTPGPPSPITTLPSSWDARRGAAADGSPRVSW